MANGSNLIISSALLLFNVHKAFTAAYVVAKWAIWPGPPPKPPVSAWHVFKNFATLNKIV